MIENNAIDRDTIEQMLESTGGEPEFVIEIIDDYLLDASGLLEQISTALDSDDAETARRSAHSLKSTSANLGAQTLAELALEVEQLSRQSRLADAASYVPAMRSEFDRVTAALRAEQTQLSGGGQ